MGSWTNFFDAFLKADFGISEGDFERLKADFICLGVPGGLLVVEGFGTPPSGFPIAIGTLYLLGPKKDAAAIRHAGELEICNNLI